LLLWLCQSSTQQCQCLLLLLLLLLAPGVPAHDGTAVAVCLSYM
jgi:hypothetical protein